MAISEEQSSRERHSRVLALPDENRDEFFLNTARLITFGAIWLTTWMLGGYYAFPQFIGLTIVAAAVGFTAIDLPRSVLNRPHLRWVWYCLAGLAAICVLSIIPLPAALHQFANGTTGIREIFARDSLGETLPRTLVPWNTLQYLSLASFGAAGLFLGICLFTTYRSRVWLLLAIATCGATQVFWGIVQKAAHPNEIFWGMPNEGGSIPFGTFLIRNHGADFVGMAVLCCFALLWLKGQTTTRENFNSYGKPNWFQRWSQDPVRIALGLLFVWLLAGFVCTFSRGGWISLTVAAMGLFLIWRGKQRRPSWGLFIALAIIAITTTLLIAAFGLSGDIRSRAKSLEVQEFASDARWQLWNDSLPALNHFLPFGSGPGTYGYAYLSFEPTATNGWLPFAHNQYLETAIEMGIPGLILIVAFIIFSGRSLSTLCDSSRRRDKQALGIAAMGTLLFQAWHAIGEFGLIMPANLLTASVLIGAGISTSPREGAKAAAESASKSPISPRIIASESSSWLPVIVTACLGVWLLFSWRHSSGRVRTDRLVAITKFDPSTPEPTTEVANQWIRQIERELSISPSCEPIRRRLIQLYLHRAQRTTFDQMLQRLPSTISEEQKTREWNATELDFVVANRTLESWSQAEREQMARAVAREPSLNQAWEHSKLSLISNPVQPKTHLRRAQLLAAAGKPWRESLANSVKLSKVDPSQSYANGLLAWATGDIETMTSQWKQTLTTSLNNLESVFRLSQLRLSDDEIVTKLMPKRWDAPFHLAILLEKEGTEDPLRRRLLTLAKDLAVAGDLSEERRRFALGGIAFRSGDHAAAIEHYRELLQTDLKNPEFRYRLALSLYQAGQAKQAASEARVAMNLEPNVDKYQRLFQQAIVLHRKQATADDPKENQ